MENKTKLRKLQISCFQLLRYLITLLKALTRGKCFLHVNVQEISGITYHKSVRKICYDVKLQNQQLTVLGERVMEFRFRGSSIMTIMAINVHFGGVPYYF